MADNRSGGAAGRVILVLGLLCLAAAGCDGGGPAPASSSAPPSSVPPSEAPPASSAAPPASSDEVPPSEAPPASASPPPASDFTYDPPGKLQAGGVGVADPTLYVPGMRFPLEQAKGFAQSQVWGHGGLQGPPGSQCDAPDYSYPWHDNFCEPRSYTTPLCPSGTGHQGQDIRPNSCQAAVYVAVAAEDGVISQIGTYTVYLSSNTGRTYLYLHMQMNQLKVHVGDHVTRGQPLGLVSNNFGSSSTTIHLHFEIKEPVTLNGSTVTTRVAPYTSLIDAYQRLLAGTP